MALIMALVLHAGAGVVALRMSTEAAQTAAPERIELELLAPAPPPAPTREVAPRPSPTREVTPRPSPRREVAPAPEVAPEPELAPAPAPEVAPVLAPAPAPEVTPPEARARAKRSLLERVMNGAGPRGALTPSLPSAAPPGGTAPSDAERAARRVAEAAGFSGGHETAEAHEHHLEALPGGGFHYAGAGFKAIVRVDGTVVFLEDSEDVGFGLPEGIGEDKDRFAYLEHMRNAQPDSVAVSGSFDLTDTIMRAVGQDPYAAEKRCFLEDIEPLRAELREKSQAMVLGAAIGELRLRMERIWSDDSRSARERRAVLFALWDECNERAAGDRARQVVEMFVREHLPFGGTDAFGLDELVALNRGAQRIFDPYGVLRGTDDAGVSAR